MVYNEKTKQEELKAVRVDRRVLELEGYVIEGPEGNKDIWPLTQQLEEDPEFSEMFQLIQPELGDTEFEGYAVRSFSLEYMVMAGEES